MRILVTGVGVVTPLGSNAERTLEALNAGRRAFGEVTLFDASGCRSRIAGEVRDLHPEPLWSRTDAMAVMAAREALGNTAKPLPVDLVVGGTTAGMFETEALLAEMHRDESARKPDDRMVCHPLSATVDRMREAVHPFGRARTVCSACSSGANALLIAAAWLRLGTSVRVLAGGADALCRLTYAGFSCLGALSPEPCLPFDARRTGLNLGEGAGFLLLETEAAARERGALPIAELRGWAVASEAHHITNPQASGETAAKVMAAALARAELAPGDIDYINAHGTATKLNDKMEAAAIQKTFGEVSNRVGVSSTKSMIGHTLGAAGAIEAAICAMAIDRGVVPPTAGLSEVDPACTLDHILTARRHPVRATLSNSFGFGGSDASIVLTAPGHFASPRALQSRKVVVTCAGTLGGNGVRDQADAAQHFADSSEPAAGAIPFEASEHLDLGRARRIDRAGRLSATAMTAAFGKDESDDREGFGAILGAAYGSVDACAKFIDRMEQKGAKFASPAVFPNLLPSSPAAHASIYHRLKGPVFSSADLDATSESAIVTAAELIAAGEADAMLAGGVEEASVIVESVLGPMCSAPANTSAERSEGAIAMLLEAADVATRPAVAEVVWWRSWRGGSHDALVEAPSPGGRAWVVAAHDNELLAAALKGSAWANVPRRYAAPHVGAHECAGGMAAAAGLSALHLGSVDRVLAVGLAPDRGYAFVLQRPG